MALTAAYEALTLDWLFSTTAVTRPTVWYLAMHVGSPGADGTTNEIVGNGYARQVFGRSRAGNVVSNTSLITFGPNTGTNWGTVTNFSLWDAATGGTCISVAPTGASVAYAVGDSATWAPGAATFTMT